MGRDAGSRGVPCPQLQHLKDDWEVLSGRSSSCRGEGAPASADVTLARCWENNSLPIVTAATAVLTGAFSGRYLLPGSDLIARKTGFKLPPLIPAPLLLSSWSLNMLLSGSLFSASSSPWNLGNHGFWENQPAPA